VQDRKQEQKPTKWIGKAAGVRQPEAGEIRLSAQEVAHGIKVGAFKKKDQP
jgi:hypothetical protein